MTSTIYLQCLIAGILGILFHVFVIKLPALKKRAKAGNVSFSAISYFLDDWIALGASLLSVLIFMFIFDEVLKFKPFIMEYVKFFFIAIGFMGSSILQAALGKTGKAIMDIIDAKTNIADRITKPDNDKL